VPAGLNEVVAISGGYQHTLALKSDGTVVAWGQNVDGQSEAPSGLSEVVAISAGEAHSVALKSDGLVGPNGATAKAQVVNGFMVGVTVVRGGRGYTEAPLVLIRGGGGSGATATATIADGSVVGFTVTNPGSGYTSLPTVSIASPPSSPSLEIVVSRVNVNLKVTLGRKYQVQATKDFKVWSLVGSDFVAESESITQELVVADTGTYFRVVEVP
jgi:hypothetical protein